MMTPDDENSAEIGILGRFLKGVQIALTAKGVPATLIAFAICGAVTAIFAPFEAFLPLALFFSMISSILITSAAGVEYRRMQWENTTQQWKDFYESNPGFLTKVVETNRAMTEAAVLVRDMKNGEQGGNTPGKAE